MEADWEFEVGGGAPVIEAVWPGFVDLRLDPECIHQIPEAVAFAPLASLLLALNGPDSPLWTAKCDLWQPEAGETVSPPPPAPPGEVRRTALACYVDLLPRQGRVFLKSEEAGALCTAWVDRLAGIPIPGCRVDLVIRMAIAGTLEGFAVTAYLSAEGREVAHEESAAATALAAALAAFAQTIPALEAPQRPASTLQ